VIHGKLGVYEQGEHTCFAFPLVCQGALNKRAGHVKAIGIHVHWNRQWPNDDWCSSYMLSLWGLIAFIWQPTDGGRLKSCKPGLTINAMRFKAAWPFMRAKEY